MRGTSLKYHIFKRNTPWGVIRKADGTLMYKHVMSFADNEILPYDTDTQTKPGTLSWWEKRDIFINAFLMKPEEITDGGSWKTVLEGKTHRAFDFLSDTRIIIRVAGSTTDELVDLKNRDFMVAKLGGKYHFFALKVLKIEGQIISFEGELDIFFTYRIRTREGSSNYITRCHTNRIGTLHIDERDDPTLSTINFESPKYFDEDKDIYDENPATKQFISTKLEPINIQKSHFGKLWERRYLPYRFDAQNEFVSVKWIIMYVNKDVEGRVPDQESDVFTPFKETVTSLTGARSLPYNIFFYPHVTQYKKKPPGIEDSEFATSRIITNSRALDGVISHIKTNRITRNFYEDWSDNSAHFKTIISPVPPVDFESNIRSFSNGVYLDNVSLVTSSVDVSVQPAPRVGATLDFSFVIPVRPDYGSTDLPSAKESEQFFGVIQDWRKNFIPEIERDYQGVMLSINAIGGVASSESENETSQFHSTIVFKDTWNIGKVRLSKNTYFNKISLDNLDPKVFSPQYFSIIVGTSSQEGKEYDFFKLTSPTTLHYLFNLDPSAASIQWFFKEATRDPILERRGFFQTLNGELPTAADPDQAFWRNNRYTISTQLQQSIRTKRETDAIAATQIALSGVGFITALFKGSLPGVAAGAGSTVQGASKLVESARTYDYTRQNINDQIKTSEALPDDITSFGSNFINTISLNDRYTEPQVRPLSVAPATQIALSKFFNAVGWSYQDYYNINSYLDSRYFFNFIQASDVFNTVKTLTQDDEGDEVEIQLSSPIKQIISNAFDEGVTLHHFRKMDTWRGVMGSYDIVNFETELAEYVSG